MTKNEKDGEVGEKEEKDGEVGAENEKDGEAEVEKEKMGTWGRKKEKIWRYIQFIMSNKFCNLKYLFRCWHFRNACPSQAAATHVNQEEAAR